MPTIEFQDDLNRLSAVLNTFAFNLTKNSEDAKDLFQETALRAIKNKDKFRPGTNLKAWLFTIMKNIFINNYRKKAKSKVVNDSTENLFYLNSTAADIENKADSNIMMKELLSMIDGLEATLRAPFLMHYEGFKYQEIADELGLPLGTVKSRIFFARKSLKEQIQNKYDFALTHQG